MRSRALGQQGAGSGSSASPCPVLPLQPRLPSPSPLPQLGEANAEREEMAGLLGGYQSSIRELQDQHSSLVVRLRGEGAALKAEVGQVLVVWNTGGGG